MNFAKVLPKLMDCHVDGTYDTDIAFEMIGAGNYNIMIIDPSSVGFFREDRPINGPKSCYDLMTLGLSTLVLTADTSSRKRLEEAGLLFGRNYYAYLVKSIETGEIISEIKRLTS